MLINASTVVKFDFQLQEDFKLKTKNLTRFVDAAAATDESHFADKS